MKLGALQPTVMRFAAWLLESADGVDADAIGCADAIVVLGAPIDADGTPSDLLRARLDTARALVEAGRARRLLVTGGHMPRGHRDAPEEIAGPAGIIRGEGWALGCELRVDRASRSTVDSARWTRSELGSGASVILVTQPFHAARAAQCFRHTGLSASVARASAAAVTHRPARAVRFALRESLARARWALRRAVFERPTPFLFPKS